MPAAHFLGLRPRLVFAQYPDDLLLAEATPFHRPSPFSGDGLYLISAEFSGCRPPATPAVASIQNGRRVGVDSERMARCVAELRMHGYQIDGDEDLLNAKLVEAIFRFQAE